MAEQQEQMAEKQRQAQERRNQKPKTQKQLEREQKKELETRGITKSVRAIYMDLVKAFHPDREKDQAERDRKTEIMQRVTQAYEKNDLLGLLRLQLEFERIDQTHIETLAEDQLKYYNKILREQAKELEEEMEQLSMQASAFSGKPSYLISSPLSLELSLDQDIREYKNIIKNIKKDLKAFVDYEQLKAFLKSYKIPKYQDEDSIFDFLF